MGGAPFLGFLSDLSRSQRTAMAEAPDTSASDKSWRTRSRAPCARAQPLQAGQAAAFAITTTVGRVSRSWRYALEGGPLPAPSVARRPLYPLAAWRSCRAPFFVERMKDLFGKMAKAEGKVEAVCESCFGGGKAVEFCRQFICAEYVKQHGNF